LQADPVPVVAAVDFRGERAGAGFGDMGVVDEPGRMAPFAGFAQDAAGETRERACGPPAVAAERTAPANARPVATLIRINAGARPRVQHGPASRSLRSFMSWFKQALSRKEFLSRLAAFGLAAGSARSAAEDSAVPAQAAEELRLPPAALEGTFALEQALHRRRSVRVFSGAPLTLQEVAQLLWAAQGVTAARGLRTAPSAGATYPLQASVVAGDVRGLAGGIYRYDPFRHALQRVREGDFRMPLAAAALGQDAVARGAISIVLAAIPRRTTGRYGERGMRYVHMEAGHAGQNVYLQAVALKLGTVVIGAFDDERVGAIVGLAADERPLYIMPVGRR
jgi:SagB-type dehydrogenase family enzyme